MWWSIKATVFIPSVKSWEMTAMATRTPTAPLTWKPRPMPTPSMKLWPIKAMAEKTPTSG